MTENVGEGQVIAILNGMIRIRIIKVVAVELRLEKK